MKMPPLFALNAGYGAIGNSLFGYSIQGYPNWKAARYIVSKDLNSGNGCATGPLPHGVKAFFAECPIAEADRFDFRHLK
jgi:hypothetical protein